MSRAWPGNRPTHFSPRERVVLMVATLVTLAIVLWAINGRLDSDRTFNPVTPTTSIPAGQCQPTDPCWNILKQYGCQPDEQVIIPMDDRKPYCEKHVYR